MDHETQPQRRVTDTTLPSDDDLAELIRDVIERGTLGGHITVAALTPQEQTWWRDGNWTDFDARAAGLVNMRNAQVATMIAHHRAVTTSSQVSAARALARSWKAHNHASHLEQKPLAEAADHMLQLLKGDTP